MAELDATAARNQPYAPRGTNDVDAILKRDDADESLQRYKAQLLGAAAQGDRGDVSDPQKPLWKSTSGLGISTPLSRCGHGDNVASMAWNRHAIAQTQLRKHVASTRGPPDCDFHTGGS